MQRFWRRTISVVLAMRQHDATLKAAAMAFDLFLGLLPLAAILGFGFSRFEGAADIRNSLIDSLRVVAPGPAAELVAEQIRRLGEHGIAIAPLSAIGFVWIASSGAHTAMASIQSARTGTTRPWPWNRAIAIGAVLVLMLLVTVAAGSLVTLHRIITTGKLTGLAAYLARIGTLLLGMALASCGSAGFFSIASWRMESARRRVVWPGALAASLLWVAVSWLFSAYVGSIGEYSVFYGSLAAVALLLLWLWLSSVLLLFGSELNLQLEGTRETMVPPTINFRRRISRNPPPPEPPTPAPQP
jgi:membrane protein